MKNGTNKYEELENLGWSAPEIRQEFLDMYRDDPELEDFLNERDMSCTNAEIGLNAYGTRDDE